MEFLKRGSLVLALVATLVGMSLASSHAAAAAPACADAAKLADEGQLAKARDAYLDVLATGDQPCAVAGLADVTKKLRAVAALCSSGAALRDAGKDADADAQYVAALKQDAASACAKAGLEPAKGFWDDVGGVVDYAPKVPAALGAVFGTLLVGIALAALVIVVLRRRAPALVIDDFNDGAGPEKLGGSISALVQERLINLGRRGRERSTHDRGGGYDLDLVVSDVELLAKDDDLAGAVGKLSDNPHLAIVTALLALFESITSQRLVVNGQLLARGSSGHGISLAVRRRGGIAARGSVWDAAIADPVTAGDPTPYYDLAVPAAAWVQYEAASLLDARVAQITSNAESFAHLGVGLEHHRNGRLHEAAKAYLDALDLDADNVAALANLSLVLAQLAELYFAAIRLLVYARATLERRHREAHAAAS